MEVAEFMTKPGFYALLKSYEALLMKEEYKLLLEVIQSSIKQAEKSKGE